MKEWDIHAQIVVKGDASAALGIVGRRGLGKIRHIDVSHLWVQERAATKQIKYEKVKGTVNVADMLTKKLGSQARYEY